MDHERVLQGHFPASRSCSVVAERPVIRVNSMTAHSADTFVPFPDFLSEQHLRNRFLLSRLIFPEKRRHIPVPRPESPLLPKVFRAQTWLTARTCPSSSRRWSSRLTSILRTKVRSEFISTIQSSLFIIRFVQNDISYCIPHRGVSTPPSP